MTVARQRSKITQVRSAEEPWGIPGLKASVQADVDDGNQLAQAASDLAWKAHILLGADISIENPADSFIWKLGLFEWGMAYDAVFSPCMIGDTIAKPTRVRSLGIQLPSLTPRCAWLPSADAFKCGRTRADPHVRLSSNHPGEPSMSTKEAAVYQPYTVKAWAADIRDRAEEVQFTYTGHLK